MVIKRKKRPPLTLSGSGYDHPNENLNLNIPLTGSMSELIEQDNPEQLINPSIIFFPELHRSYLLSMISFIFL